MKLVQEYTKQLSVALLLLPNSMRHVIDPTCLHKKTTIRIRLRNTSLNEEKFCSSMRTIMPNTTMTTCDERGKTHNHEGRGCCQSKRNCNRGDLVKRSLEVCVSVNALKVLLLLSKFLPRSERSLCHPAVIC